MPRSPGAHIHNHLTRSECLERVDLDQGTPAGMRPCERLCIRCGRVTARRGPDGMPWCGGDPVTPEQRTAEIAPGRWMSPTGPVAA